MQLDQRKSATLPELKVKYPQAPAVVKNAVASREKKEVSPGAKALPTTETAGVKETNSNISRMNSSDDNVVVEKTVVMLENEVVSTPPVILHSGRNAAKETSSDDRTEKPSPESEYIAIRAPLSPVILPEAEGPVTNGSDDQGSSHEVCLCAVFVGSNSHLSLSIVMILVSSFRCIVFLVWYVCSHKLKGQTLLCTIKLNVSCCNVIMI